MIEYLTIERRTEYIQYKSSLKSNSARDCISYSTLKTISIKISTHKKSIHKKNIHKKNIHKKNIHKKNIHEKKHLQKTHEKTFTNIHD